MDIKTRQEFELIPQGVSVTETEVSVYLRYRKDDTVATLRVSKEDLYACTVSIDQLVDIDPKDWHCVWGMKG